MSTTAETFTPERIGPYRIIRLIATGAMGTVYLAQRDDASQPVALKVPRYHDPHLLARFTQRESRAMLCHNNIVEVYEAGEQDGQYFIAMAYLPGGSLAHELRRLRKAGQRMPLQRAASIAAQIASALAYAHAHGVIHRDIKPGNILFAEDGRAVLTDFGIARVYDPNAAEDGLTGVDEHAYTAKYASPEQRRGLLFTDARSDIFSLGRVLYEMLAGDIPRDARWLKPLWLARPDVPRALRRVVAQATRKNPARRFQRADQMAAALSAVLQPAQKATETVRKPAHWAIGAGLAACVLALGVLFAAPRIDGAQSNPTTPPAPTSALIKTKETGATAEVSTTRTTPALVESLPPPRESSSLITPTLPTEVGFDDCAWRQIYTPTVCSLRTVTWQESAVELRADFDIHNVNGVALLAQPATPGCAALSADGRESVMLSAVANAGAGGLTLDKSTLVPGSWRVSFLVTRKDGVDVTVGEARCVLVE